MAEDRTALGLVMATLVRDVGQGCGVVVVAIPHAGGTLHSTVIINPEALDDAGVDAAIGRSIREAINRGKVQHDGASAN